MATHSSTLAWKIPWTEEPGRLQSMASLRVGHDWTTSLSLFIFIHWRRKWNPLQCSCLVNLGDGGAWWAAVYGVAQSRTRLKRLSSSSSSKTNQVFWTQIHACSTCCMWGTCLGLGSCLGIISWCEGPSGSISCFQMKNQDQESRRGLAKVAVDQGNWVTSSTGMKVWGAAVLHQREPKLELELGLRSLETITPVLASSDNNVSVCTAMVKCSLFGWNASHSREWPVQVHQKCFPQKKDRFTDFKNKFIVSKGE